MTGFVVWLHVVATVFLCGLIWVIQVVHYPLMSEVPEDRFRGFHARHTRLISRLVVPPMLVELATSILLVWRCPDGVSPALPATGAGLLLIVWLSTFGLQVPAHRRLESGWDSQTHRRLVRTNWIRTWAWTLRAGIAVAITITAAS
ncbi:MAG: hypothetical protein V2I67_18970 [Thermoanaerobaculales bacterium]|nr:hypothetical protein [Thermoanaerobaculales bacterium]